MTHDWNYDGHKILWYLDRVARLQVGEPCAPVHLNMDLLTTCNHRCKFCINLFEGDNDLYRHLGGKGVVIFPYQRIPSLFAELQAIGLKAISFSGGDPFCHPQFGDIVALAFACGFRVGIITNGTQITDAFLANTAPWWTVEDWIRLSVNAATPELYQQLNGTHVAFTTVLDILRSLCARTAATVGAGMVICSANTEELEQFAEIMAEVGVAAIRYTLDTCSPLHVVESEVVSLLPRLQAIQSRYAGRIHVYESVSRRLSPTKIYPSCYQHHLAPKLLADGRLAICCQRQWETAQCYGNVLTSSFADIWYGEARRHFLATFDLATCPPCQFDARNETMHQPLTVLQRLAHASSASRPLHTEFL